MLRDGVPDSRYTAMNHFKMNTVDWTALVLVVVGAINWGLVGIAYFVDANANWNLVNLVLGSAPAVESAVYLLVGLAGLYAMYFASRIVADEPVDSDVEMGERRTTK